MKFVKRLFPGPLLRQHLRDERLSDKKLHAFSKMMAEGAKDSDRGKRKIKILIPPIY